jgi:hypothetical protein
MGGTSSILGRWLRMRDKIKDGEKALFLNLVDSRLDPFRINRIAKDAEVRVNSTDRKIRFHPHRALE